MGNKVSNYVLFNPWLGQDPFALETGCTENCYSNVMFLPGLEASRLYDNQNSSCIADKVDPTRAWEPSCNADARKLYLDASGKSLDAGIHTKEGDILDETKIGANIYKSFIEQMDQMKNTDHLINYLPPFGFCFSF